MTTARVIRTYLALVGLSTLSASLIWGVNTLFLLDAGLDIAEVFIANAAFTVAQMVTNAAIVVGTISGGLLGSIDLALPFVLRAGLLVPVFAIAFVLMRDLGFAGRPLSRSTVVGEMRGVARAAGCRGRAALAAMGVGLAPGFPAAMAALLVFGAASGTTTPVKQAVLHDSIPTEQRATLMSFDSLVGNVGSVGGQVGLGLVARERGIPDGYVLGGALTALAIPVLFALRRVAGRADHAPG